MRGPTRLPLKITLKNGFSSINHMPVCSIKRCTTLVARKFFRQYPLHTITLTKNGLLSSLLGLHLNAFLVIKMCENTKNESDMSEPA